MNCPPPHSRALLTASRICTRKESKGAVDVHSPDYYEGAKRFAYIAGDSDGGRVSAVWAILPTGEIATLVKNPGAVVPLDDVFGSIRQQGGKWLFALSTDKLTDLYTSYGYVPVAWLQWDNAQAPASWDYNRYGRPSPAFFVHRYYLTPAQCETYEAEGTWCAPMMTG